MKEALTTAVVAAVGAFVATALPDIHPVLVTSVVAGVLGGVVIAVANPQ